MNKLYQKTQVTDDLWAATYTDFPAGVQHLIYKQNMFDCKITNEECYKDEIMLASDAHTHTD